MLKQNGLKSIAKILAGTGGAQIVAFLFLPILSRLFAPDEFGLYAAVLAANGILVAIATAQLHTAIVIPKDDKQANALAAIAILGCAAMALILGALATSKPLLNALGINHWIGAITAAILVANGAALVSSSLATRYGLFGYIGLAALARATTVAIVQTILGLNGFGVYGLLLPYLIGEILYSALLIVAIRVMSKPVLANYNDLRGAFLDFVDFPKFGLPQELLGAGSQNISSLIIGASLGSGVLGQYAMAMRLLMAPAQLIGGSLRQVLSAQYAARSNKGVSINREIKKTTAGQFAEYLVLWTWMLVANVPSVVGLRIKRRQELSLKINAAIFVLRTCYLLGFSGILSPVALITGFAILNTLANGALIETAIRNIRTDEINIKR